MDMSFEKYVEGRVKLVKAQAKPDKIEGRFAQLHEMENRTTTQECEYKPLLAAMRARYKMELAEQKARKELGRREDADRKADSHAKILIGIAAIQIAKNDPALAAQIEQLASGMQSANRPLIREMLNTDKNRASTDDG
jgi:hypothetical protein